MNDREAIELIRAYCEDRVPPEVFELRFYADDSCMDRVLGERSAAWPPPITSSPYFAILDLSLTRDVARAKQIFRAFLACRPEREPVSAQQLDEVERRLGVQLPEAYRDFVSKFDPRAIGPRTLRVPQPVPEELRFYLAATLGVHALFAPGLDEGDGTSILSTLPMRREWGLPEGLVLLDGDGHTWLALDHRASALDPPVVFFATDTDAPTSLRAPSASSSAPSSHRSSRRAHRAARTRLHGGSAFSIRRSSTRRSDNGCSGNFVS